MKPRKRKPSKYKPGDKLGKLTIVRVNEFVDAPFHIRKVCFVRCDCGVEKYVREDSLYGGNGVKGCKACRASGKVIHGLTNTPEHKVWSGMIHRCDNENGMDYHNYGGRGISIAPAWRKFVNFYNDMGPRPSKRHSIDRVDPDGNYEPGNCRWVTHTEQCANKRVPIMSVVWNGETRTIKEWSRYTKINYATLLRRLNELEWDVEKALTTPSRSKPHSEQVRVKVGDTYGQWSVLAIGIYPKPGPMYCKVKCVCGTTQLVIEHRLRTNPDEKQGCRTCAAKRLSDAYTGVRIVGSKLIVGATYKNLLVKRIDIPKQDSPKLGRRRCTRYYCLVECFNGHESEIREDHLTNDRHLRCKHC